MAVTKEKKLEFNDNVGDFKAYLEDLKKEATVFKVQMKKSKAIEPYFQISLALNGIKTINTCLLINELSVHLLDINNNNYLELARKEVYNTLSAIEKVIGTDIEGSLNDNQDKLALIKEFSPVQKLNFVKALKDCIRRLIDAFGSNSKWKWSWPDIHLRSTIVTKNIFDFREFQANDNLEDPNYYIRREHFNLIIESANSTAQDFRQKFDMSTQKADDLKQSLLMLDLNRRIFQITGETDDIEKTKTIIESLQQKIESLETADDKKKKKKA